MNRRAFIGSVLALGAAPAVVRASSLMPINQSRWSAGETLIVPRRMANGYIGGYGLTLQLLDWNADTFKVMLCGVEHTIQSTAFAQLVNG